jgi:hypothetical protein
MGRVFGLLTIAVGIWIAVFWPDDEAARRQAADAAAVGIATLAKPAASIESAVVPAPRQVSSGRLKSETWPPAAPPAPVAIAPAVPAPVAVAQAPVPKPVAPAPSAKPAAGAAVLATQSAAAAGTSATALETGSPARPEANKLPLDKLKAAANDYHARRTGADIPALSPPVAAAPVAAPRIIGSAKRELEDVQRREPPPAPSAPRRIDVAKAVPAPAPVPELPRRLAARAGDFDVMDGRLVPTYVPPVAVIVPPPRLEAIGQLPAAGAERAVDTTRPAAKAAGKKGNGAQVAAYSQRETSGSVHVAQRWSGPMYATRPYAPPVIVYNRQASNSYIRSGAIWESLRRNGM